MLTVGEVSKGHLELREDPEAWIKNNPASRLALVTSLKLDLFNKDGVEEIGEFLGELTQLIRLEFCHCRSLKCVPANIGQLASLTHLVLCYCNNIKFLPDSIVNLSNLTSLTLSYCKSLVELPENIGQLASLTHLELTFCENIKSLPTSIAKLPKLTSLSLSSELPSNLGHFKKCLSHLSLHGCDWEELPATVCQLGSLTHLDLISCNNIKFLPNSIANLSNLTSLSLYSCHSLVELPANIGQLVSLTHLKLHSCDNIKFLPDSIVNLSNLTSLTLFNCKSLVELPANLDGLAHLCLLDIQPSNIKCLPWSITKLRKLQHLMLPIHFRLETLPYELNNSVTISVQGRHVRKSWEELKTEIGELRIPLGGEIGNDAAQNPSIISPPGYLRLKEDDLSQWIINNRNLLMLVRFLDLENFKELTDSIMQFSELTHLYLYITGHICPPDNYFVTFTRLTHLSLDFSVVVIDKCIIHRLSKLSNLQTLHLRSLGSELPGNFNMPVSLKHLSLSSCNMRPLYDSLEKLTNLWSLDLNSCDYCESLPPCKYIHKLRLVDCYLESLDSLPIGLHHLQILFSEDYNDLRCIFEKCWNKLVNLETLSITCSEMEFIPEDIARLHNLQKLQLKDCISLKKLPSNLHELVNLHTLDISVTRIKILPPSFVKLRNLQHLILPKCFNFERLPRSLKQVSIIDDTEEAYYKSNYYDASLYKASASNESEDEVTKLIVVPGESCNEDDYLVPTVEIHETVPVEQTSADPFNSISMGSIEYITTAQGGISQIYKDSHFNVSKDPIDENIQHIALCSQNQFNPLGNGGFMTNRPGADFFGVNNQHVINDGQFDSMTLENEHEIASICQNISSWDGNSIVGGWNNHHALDLGHNNNSQSYHANVIRQEKEITPEAILEPEAEKHDEYNSPKEMPDNINVVHPWLNYHCRMQFPPRDLMKVEHLKISLCKCSKELLANLKESMNLLHLAIKDCSQHHVKRFPTNFNELANLKTLSIRCIHIESLPSFAGLCSLLKLYIGGVSPSAPSLEKLPANLDNLDKLLVVDIRDTKIKCLPWSIKNLQKLRFLNLPLDFRLETLSCQLIASVVITVDCMHIRKTWKELKTEMGLLSFRGVGVDEVHNFSTISSSGYLPLKEDPGLWIMKNYDLCVSVRSLELELPVYLPKIGDSIGELPKLTYLYISGNINLDLKHLSGISKTLRHLSLQHCNIELLSTSLRKLSNLEFLCLDLGDTNLPSNLDLLVNLKHLSLRHGSKHSNINSLARLSNLKALDLFQCDLESLPANLKLAELKLSGSIIKSLPTSLHRLEILHDKGRCEGTKCDVASLNLKHLINIEKLSVTCYSMKLLPSIERLQNLQELQLKDCSSLEALPNYLGKLVKLCTLDISGTRIKSLPDSITKLSNLEHLILPKCFQQDSSLKYPNKGFINVTIDDIVELYFNDMSYDDDGYETSMETSDAGNGIDLDSIEGHNEAISKELEEGSINVQTSPHKVHVIPILEDFCSSRSETPNPEGESIPAIRNDQNDITTMLIEQENGQKQVPQRNKVERNKRTEISEEKLQQCWSENPMSLQETAEKIFGVSRSTMKRRLKELKLEWPSSKKGKQNLDDAKKRKHNSKAPFCSDSTQQNLVIPTNSTAQTKIVRGRIIGATQLTLPNHVSSNSDVVGNLAPDTIVESVRGNLMDTQGNMDSQHGEEHYLDGANDQGHLEGVLHSTESNLAATLETFEEPLMVIESHMDIQQQVQGRLEGALHTTESDRAATLEETFDPMVIESHMDTHQQAQGHLEGAEVHLNGANERTLSDTLPQNEKSSNFIVKAWYNDDIVRFDFSLSKSIDRLKEEIANQLELEVNTFKIKYQDEDKDLVSVTRIFNLEHALNLSRSSNNSSVVKLFIFPKT